MIKIPLNTFFAYLLHPINVFTTYTYKHLFYDITIKLFLYYLLI